MTRTTRAQLATQTLGITAAGHYTSPAGQLVSIARDLADAIADTRTIPPQDFPALIAASRARPPRPTPARISITAETTLAALHRTIAFENNLATAALNFASAKNPGGGYLSGAQAQEESLARSSALVATLLPQTAYYAANRAAPSHLYTDHAILSPFVPVFVSDDGHLLEAPYTATFITMPAPNLSAMPPASPDRGNVPATLRHRIDCVFALAAHANITDLILGAWGCGVFRNHPNTVAELFAQSLSGPNSWRPHFHQITFAIHDPGQTPTNRLPFQHHLAKLL